MNRFTLLVLLLLVSCNHPPEGTVKTSFDESGQIVLVESRGYRSAIEAPTISFSANRLQVTAGLPAKPASEAEKSKGKGIYLWYVASVLSFLGGVLAAFRHNYRLAGLLTGGGVLMGILAALIASPWMPALGLVLVIGAGFLWWGYSLRH